MGKLILKILFFISPFVIILVFIPVDRRLQYQGLENDCFNHALWIHDRIFINAKPVDIAFLGSSRTINNINDQMIEEKLHPLKFHVVNFGYCRFGRNLSYVLMKDILKETKVHILILEVREDEDRYSHPIFPYIAETRDVFLAYPFFNKNLIFDYYRHLTYKLETLKDDYINRCEEVPVRQDAYGFSSFDDTASIELLNEAKMRRNMQAPKLSGFSRNFHMQYPRKYLKDISDVCKENDIRICFLYLPAYGTSLLKPAEFYTYMKYGEIFIPPSGILNNTNNWFDENHFNQNGARELSGWIACELKMIK